MSHHYGEYWSRWNISEKNDNSSEQEEHLLVELKSFLLTLEQNEKTAHLIERLEKEIKEHHRIVADF
jgi:hypothetical protein